jgi:hypothetical protein
MDRLKVYGKIIDGAVDGRHEAGLVDAGRPHGGAAEHGMRKQAVVALVYIPAEPDDTRDCGAAEEADDAGITPGILVAAVLEGEEEL